MTKSKPKSTATIIDVARPNETAPSDTSVPVIVNNRPILRDPMMANESQNLDIPATETPKLSPTSTKINIQPLSSDEDEVSKERAKTEEPAEPEVETSENTPDTEDHSENAIEADNQAQTKTEDEKNVIESEEQAKHESDLQNLVESKKYYLPINTVQKRRTKRFVAIGAGVSILLVLIWVDIALDAGLIKIGGLKALTHIFST